MSLTISVFELGMTAWSHQSSHCIDATPQFDANVEQPQAIEIRAAGYSRLYGVTPMGDELDLTLRWRAQGPDRPDVDQHGVFGDLIVDAGIHGPVSLDQAVMLIDADGVPLPTHKRSQALLASIRYCSWRLPARQCLARHRMRQTRGHIPAHRTRGLSTVSA